MSAFTAWRAPADSEIADGVAALAAIVGPMETAKLSWQRRLALSDAGEWLLVVTSGGQPTIPTFAPWADPIQLQVFQTAYPLAEAVEILQGPNNPEAILAERRRRVAEHEAEETKAKALAKAQQAEREADAAQWERDKTKFNHAAWVRLAEWQQAFYALACRVKDRDPSLAKDLRVVAAEGRGSSPARPSFPRAEWER
jgi:hypothetical protein